MTSYHSPNQAQKKRHARTAAAVEAFSEVSALAAANGLRLERKTDIQYQLMPQDRSWLLNIYPSNRRLYRDLNKQGAPYLKLPANWTLLDVVRAAVGGKET